MSHRRRDDDGIDDDEDDAGEENYNSDARTASSGRPESDAESGEDLDPTLNRDYRAVPALDTLEGEDLDEREYENMTYEQRMAAENEIQEREVRRARIDGRLPRAFDDDQEEDEFARISKRRRRDELTAQEMEIDIAIDDIPEGITLKDYLEGQSVQKEVEKRFSDFLRKFADAKGNPVYRDKIRTMCTNNKQSLEVSYLDLSKENQTLALWVAECPAIVLEIFDRAALRVVLETYSNYAQIHNQIYVRIADLPICDLLRDIRQVHLNVLIKVAGVVTRRSGVYPQLKLAMFDCGKCGHILGPFYQSSFTEIKLGHCPQCQSKGPFNVNQEKTLYRNYQNLTLQETPGSVPAGRLPRHKEIVLLGDLIDCARPGEEVEITGIYTNNFDSSLNTRNGFPVFSTLIEANHVAKKADRYAAIRLSKSEEHEIIELSKRADIAEMIISSIAPSIWGHEDIKTAIAMSLFGGQPKVAAGKHRIRGDINILMLGDPGTAKSQCLKYIEKTAHRAVFTTGKGASAVGLTAAVHKDPITREWTLEGGALVLADTGICIIDEFDKMSDQDRTSIHEAMEQQTISISKAGIVTTLQARCAVIAAANPKGGKYNSTVHFGENVDLTEPILSRFDILCVVKDVVDPIMDHRLATFVVNSHIKSHPSADPEDVKAINEADAGAKDGPIPQELLKKYIMYAKQNCFPQLRDIDNDKVAKLYADLRRESQAGGGIPIAVRHVESIVRMSEAYARMHLRDHVRDDDVNFAIRVMLQSFISAQKFSVQRSLQKTFQRYISYHRDNDALLFILLEKQYMEEMSFKRNKRHLGFHSLDETVTIDQDEFEIRAREMRIHEVRSFYKSAIFLSAFRLDEASAKIIKTA